MVGVCSSPLVILTNHVLAPPGSPHPSAQGAQIISSQRTAEVYETSHCRRHQVFLSSVAFFWRCFCPMLYLCCRNLLLAAHCRENQHAWIWVYCWNCIRTHNATPMLASFHFSLQLHCVVMLMRRTSFVKCLLYLSSLLQINWSG